jgi:hypothetical protein
MMQRTAFWLGLPGAGILLEVALIASAPSKTSVAQAENRPAFVIVERTETTGPETIQEEYGKLARDILPKYGGRYLARSQRNILLEGEGGGAVLHGDPPIPECRCGEALVRVSRKPGGCQSPQERGEIPVDCDRRASGPAVARLAG